MKTKKVVKANHAVNGTEAQALPVGNPPPKVNAPAPPKSWTKSKRVRPKEGLKPTASQTDAVAGAAIEMRESTTWVDDFGSKAPDPTSTADILVTASQWRDAWVTASKWVAYCADQRRVWEDAAFTEVGELKPLFDYASVRDASIAKRYSSTKLIVGARSASAQRGATTRKNNKKKAAKAVVPDLPTSSVNGAAH